MLTTRFAPSPTGYLHVGGARTALYSWLFAKQHKGKFMLRIEDTDRDRSTQESIDQIISSMKWLGLDWDIGPINQTDRTKRYQEVIQRLLDSGQAYKCCCSKQRLDVLREQQMANKQKPKYDGHCRDANLQVNQDYVIRFKTPISGNIEFIDAVRGKIIINNNELDDLIICRSDGSPTYNLAVVVDDWDFNISHVIRGEDHISNTPRQIQILKALQAPVPEYAHIPIILGSDGKRLSKRHGALGVMQYREEGFLPQALINYLARLGWSHGDQEIFSVKEMLDLFSLDAVNNSAAVFNPDKLLWLNQHYIKNLPFSEIKDELAWHFQRLNIAIDSGPNLQQLLEVQRDRAKTLVQLATESRFFYQPIQLDNQQANKFLKNGIYPALEDVTLQLKNLSSWQEENIAIIIKTAVDKFQIKFAKLAQPIRYAVTASTSSPSIDKTLYLLGKDKTIERLTSALEWISVNQPIT